MNKEEALKTDQEIKAYFQKNKLRGLFSELMKQVLLHRPADPISYLIDYIQKRNKRQVICIHGYDDQKRNKISTNISNKYNFGLINFSSLFSGEDYHFYSNTVINERVATELAKLDKVYKGIIISGYPNNAAQADFIHKSGTLPDRYFLLYNDEPAIRTAYSRRYDENQVGVLLDRNSLEEKELKEILGDQYDQLPASVEKAIDKISSSISIKFKKNTPYQSPRIVLLHPPFLVPHSLTALHDKYSFHLITLENSFKKLSKKQSFNQYVETHIRRTKSLSKEIQLALIQTECKSAASKHKGFIVAGWPSKKSSAAFLKQHFLNPHLVFIFNSVKEKAFEQFNKLDPQNPVFTIVQKPSLPEYKALYKEYQELTDLLKGNSNSQLLSLGESDNQVLKTFDSLIDNPKIYS